jgi:fumarate hydratase class II
MPGKVNPFMSELAHQGVTQVIGNDAFIALDAAIAYSS